VLSPSLRADGRPIDTASPAISTKTGFSDAAPAIVVKIVGGFGEDGRMPALADVRRGQPVGLVVVPELGLALAWDGGGRSVATVDPADAVQTLAGLDPRWTWWSARVTAAPLIAAGSRPRTCWDLGAVGRLLHGLHRDDPAAIWAAEHDLPIPPPPNQTLDLFDLDESDAGPIRSDGQLSREWAHGGGPRDLSQALRWAELGLDLQQRQARRLRARRDPRAAPREPSLALLTAYAESAAALLGVELTHDGLPVDRRVATELLTAIIGPRPTDGHDEADQRRERDREVLRHFSGADDVDLRSPGQVRELLVRVGLDLPDTRSWRLKPHAATSEAVAALLAWRAADRISSTYGWRWLDSAVGTDGRLRGAWSSADGGAGRMTAQSGLHNLPATLRPAVSAEAGHSLVRADLGQVEPRVLAAISGDEAFIGATHDLDMYAPVAARLNCDRPTAKISVLAAMYGQTSGSAGDTMRAMERAYPQAVAYLHEAESHGRDHTDMRTYGGRLIRLSGAALDAAGVPVTADVAASHGRYSRNAAVQGPAAELFKAWAATVRDGLTQLDGQIVLCLHDELLLHVPTPQVAAAVALLHHALAATVSWWAAGSDVRFVAEVSSGANWTDAH
jgi:DNA polymerase-1